MLFCNYGCVFAWLCLCLRLCLRVQCFLLVMTTECALSRKFNVFTANRCNINSLFHRRIKNMLEQKRALIKERREAAIATKLKKESIAKVCVSVLWSARVTVLLSCVVCCLLSTSSGKILLSLINMFDCWSKSLNLFSWLKCCLWSFILFSVLWSIYGHQLWCRFKLLWLILAFQLLLIFKLKTVLHINILFKKLVLLFVLTVSPHTGHGRSAH